MQYSSDEKIRIVISGFCGGHSIAELCRWEGIAEGLPASASSVITIASTLAAMRSDERIFRCDLTRSNALLRDFDAFSGEYF